MILVCKSIYSVFSARPTSINSAVAYNVAGPALADAVRAVRCSQNPGPAPPLSATPESLMFSPREMHELDQNALIAQKFEDIFGSWHTNRLSWRSTLRPTESLRFQRALHRVIMYSGKFSPGHNWSYLGIQSSDELESVQAERKDLLSPYRTEELIEMQTVVAFVTHVLQEVFGYWDRALRTRIQWALSAGPARILEAFEAQSDEPIQREFEIDIYQGDDDYAEYDDFFTNAFSRIWKERGITASPPLGGILDESPDPQEICVHCRRLGSVELWNESHWTYIDTRLPYLFMGNLASNLFVVDVLRGIKTSKAPSIYMPEMFTHATPEFNTWNAGDPMCIWCLKKFMRKHLTLWLLHAGAEPTAGFTLISADKVAGVEPRPFDSGPNHVFSPFTFLLVLFIPNTLY
ncbi:hypothetical protein FB451DRAFT_1409255 [Mycena latifolia]|nr:hypothetical protein FB451DRAFT_1409255 [Mycena latifolia]